MGQRNGSSKSTIALSLGDPNGIGPEVLLRALPDLMTDSYKILVFGHVGVLEFWARRMGMGDDFADRFSAVLTVVEPDEPCPPVEIGRATSAGGAASLAYFRAAVASVLDGRASAVVTNPVSKEAWALAGSQYRGHTDLLKDLCNADDCVMMLANSRLRVALVTTHIPLGEVPAALSVGRIERVIRITAVGLRDFGLTSPRLAVAGLNPHAGEMGLLGTEEIEIIEPAIRRSREAGIDARGPFPADSLFHQADGHKYDAVVAMYHDQGLAPLKALSFKDTVNVTLGLPIIRTSVGHGTGYDIAGKGIADPTSLICAVRLAELMAGNRKTRMGRGAV
jgi:4-hydroxythreonine-4-phosphate dehydrogenase